MSELVRRKLVPSPSVLESTRDFAVRVLKSRRWKLPQRGLDDPLADEDINSLADDIVQDIWLNPPEWDPAKGSEETLIRAVVKNTISNYARKRRNEARKHKKYGKHKEYACRFHNGTQNRMPLPSKHRFAGEERKTVDIEDVLKLIDDPSTCALCQQFIECGGNISATARCLGLTEGAVRSRLKRLKARLLTKGFNPVEFAE